MKPRFQESKIVKREQGPLTVSDEGTVDAVAHHLDDSRRNFVKFSWIDGENLVLNWTYLVNGEPMGLPFLCTWTLALRRRQQNRAWKSRDECTCRSRKRDKSAMPVA